MVFKSQRGQTIVRIDVRLKCVAFPPLAPVRVRATFPPQS